MSNIELADDTDVDNIYLNRNQAMRLLGVSRTTFASIVKRHKVPKCMLTRRPLYRRADLIQLVENNMSAKTKKAAA